MFLLLLLLFILSISFAGNEFRGQMKSFLKEKGVTHKMLKSNQKAAVAERVCVFIYRFENVINCTCLGNPDDSKVIQETSSLFWR